MTDHTATAISACRLADILRILDAGIIATRSP